MSYRAEFNVWEFSQLKGSARMVAARIANQCNDAGIAYPSLDSLARTTRLTPRQISNIVADMQKSGEWAILRGGMGRGDSHHYIALLGVAPESAREIVRLCDEYARQKDEIFSSFPGGKGENYDAERMKLLARKGEILDLLDHYLLDRSTSGSSKKRTPKAAPEQPPKRSARDYTDAYLRITGYPSKDVDWSNGESKAAAFIAERWTVDQFEQGLRHVIADPFWTGKRITLRYLKQQMPALVTLQQRGNHAANQTVVTTDGRVSASGEGEGDAFAVELARRRGARSAVPHPAAG